MNPNLDTLSTFIDPALLHTGIDTRSMPTPILVFTSKNPYSQHQQTTWAGERRNMMWVIFSMSHHVRRASPTRVRQPMTALDEYSSTHILNRCRAGSGSTLIGPDEKAVAKTV